MQKLIKPLIMELAMTARMISLLLPFLFCGCAHIELNNLERLINRTDFEQARLAAPEWCRDALKTINYLEMEIERQ